jgi:hypothetical protein
MDEFAWEGNRNDFDIDLNTGQIRLFASGAGKSFLTMQSGRLLNTVWSFRIRLLFNPSSGNYADVYLCSDTGDLTAGANAYFVRIGYTDDNISLYRRKGTGAVKIITGKSKRIDLSQVDVEIKVECSSAGEWTLSSRLNTEQSFFDEGQVVDYNEIHVKYFGLLCVYTATRNKSFYFNDIRISVLNEDDEKETADLFMPSFKEVIINEVLFNADDKTCEYVELYNRSDKKINLSRLTFALRKQDGSLTGKCNLSIFPKALYPRQFIVLTKDKEKLCAGLNCCDAALYENVALPALNNAGADLVLINRENEIIDEFCYSEKMHQEMIYNKEGISLERIDPDAETQNPENWQTASFDAGYGTPGCKNSQADPENNRDDIWLDSDVVSNDDLVMNYRFKKGGQPADIFIYDVNGKLIKRLANNVLLGTSGRFEWNIRSDLSMIDKSGMYIIYVEYRDVYGSIRRKKLAVVLNIN